MYIYILFIINIFKTHYYIIFLYMLVSYIIIYVMVSHFLHLFIIFVSPLRYPNSLIQDQKTSSPAPSPQWASSFAKLLQKASGNYRSSSAAVPLETWDLKSGGCASVLTTETTFQTELCMRIDGFRCPLVSPKRFPPQMASFLLDTRTHGTQYQAAWAA